MGMRFCLFIDDDKIPVRFLRSEKPWNAAKITRECIHIYICCWLV